MGYVQSFNDGGVPYFASTFSDEATGIQYNSVLVQAPGSLAAGAKSLVNIEILGTSSALSPTPHSGMVRASPSSLAVAHAHLESAPRKLSADGKPVLAKVHRSFA